jgi:hypothetical protein
MSRPQMLRVTFKSRASYTPVIAPLHPSQSKIFNYRPICMGRRLINTTDCHKISLSDAYLF